jgi:uncharacterized membrane protein
MSSPLPFKLKNEITSLIIIVSAIVLSFATYSHLPEIVASHWNFAGQVDGWSSRNFHAIFFPALLLFIYLLFTFLPRLDPKKENYPKFARTYRLFEVALLFTLFLVYAIATLVNLNYPINVGVSISLIVGLLMFAIGYLIKDIKENWFIGIRTPWTLSSPTVWEKTHAESGYFFLILGVIIIVTPYYGPPWNYILFGLGISLVIFGSIIYSYLIYRAEQKTKKIFTAKIKKLKK